MLWLACVAVMGCASSPAPAPEGPTETTAQKILAGCKEQAVGPGAVRYDCQGFFAVADEAPAGGADDPDSDVDELVAEVVQEFGPLRDKFGARVRVEKSVLEDAGIQCFLEDENVVRMDWLGSNAMGGIKLVVRKKDAEAAEKLLSERPADETANTAKEQ